MGEESLALHDHADRGRIFCGGAVERDLDDRTEVRCGREVFAHGEQTSVLHAQTSVRGPGSGERDEIPVGGQAAHPLVTGVDEVQRPRSSAVQAPPPYSCTRERAFQGAGRTSAPVELRTVTRPFSDGTDSPHQMSVPTKRAPSMRGEAAATEAAEKGEGQEP